MVYDFNCIIKLIMHNRKFSNETDSGAHERILWPGCCICWCRVWSEEWPADVKAKWICDKLETLVHIWIFNFIASDVSWSNVSVTWLRQIFPQVSVIYKCFLKVLQMSHEMEVHMKSFPKVLVVKEVISWEFPFFVSSLMKNCEHLTRVPERLKCPLFDIGNSFC